MKKFFLFFLFAALMSGSMAAQDVLMATLQHGDNMQAFQGPEALKNALAASQDGDLITLSAGGFNACHITKAVTIQGAGYVTDAEKGIYPTVIDGNFTIKLPKGSEGLTIEGIYYTDGSNSNTITVEDDITSFAFKKSRISNIAFNGHPTNCLIDQCRVANSIRVLDSDNFLIRNSIINGIFSNSGKTIATIFLENCVITNGLNQNVTTVLKNSIINIVYTDIFECSLSNSSSAYNNISCNPSNMKIMFKDAAIQSGNQYIDANTLFGDKIDYDDSKTYRLTETAQLYLGTDGKQIGIYGGDRPFTSVPTNPQITQKSIPAKSTSDGKLSISITVEAQN